MKMAKTKLMHAMTSRRICGHGLVPEAQALREERGGSAFVALKIVKVAVNIESTIREQEKLTPRRTILAMRTRILTFWWRETWLAM